jgi:DMSO reductase family type II enzyme chaperone
MRTAIQSKEISSLAESHASFRTRMYCLCAESFRYPDQSFRQQIKNGALKQAFADVFRGLPFDFDWTDTEKQSVDQAARISGQDIEVEFIRLFESGPGNPPLPLLEGLYHKDRRSVFKELLLFYNHFGLSYAEGAMTDRPDHICYELEFLHFLTFKELLALQTDQDCQPYLRAQNDFLERHLLNWLGLILQKTADVERNLPAGVDACVDVLRFYHSLLHMTFRYLTDDSAYVKMKLKGCSQPSCPAST